MIWNGQTFAIRYAVPSDEAYVFGTWLNGYRHAMRHVEHGAYFAGQRRRIRQLWPDVHVLCRAVAPDSIYAWVCGRPGVLHYVYILPELQRRGLARALVTEICGEEVDMTHRWPWSKSPRGWRPNEYRLEDSE